jgi:hypothetical protein
MLAAHPAVHVMTPEWPGRQIPKQNCFDPDSFYSGNAEKTLGRMRASFYRTRRERCLL